jgi:outer membrane protein assembly factor BamB
VQRRLVAVGDRVYITLAYHAPVTQLDAATGEECRVYEGTEGAEEIVWHDGVLLLVVRSVTGERVAELDEMAQLAGPDGSPLHKRESADPLVKQFRQTENQALRTVIALEADTGRVLWQKTGAEAGLRSLSLCASGDRVFWYRGGKSRCLDLRTGEELWAVESPPLRLVSDGSVICASNKAVTALSAGSGDTRWTQDTILTNVRDVFVAGGSLWLGGFKPFQRENTKHTGPAWGPYFATQRDLATGEVTMHIEPENPGHHHRCYANKATDRFILAGRRGTEFIDLQSGEVLWHSWARGVCRYGVMPANGLLYVPPHACGCYVAAKLISFNALASGPAQAPPPSAEEPRPERGPAYDAAVASGAALPGDWPTYRHDPARSGCGSGFSRDAALQVKWRAEVGGRITSPTVAGKMVFVASADEHRVCVIDAESGDPVWHFTAGGRIDSPPTLHEGRAVFGSHDGHVYSVRASDGALAWRLRAARDERRVVVRGQVESASPVHGSVLVADGVAYLTAGRSSYLDGGIDLCRLNPRTGEMLSRTPVYSPDPETGRQPQHIAPSIVPGARADILTADADHIYLRDTVFDRGGKRQPEGLPHLFTLTDFLDDSWPHRSYWILGTKPSIATGCSGRAKNLIYGRLLVFDDATVYGYGRRNVHWSNQLEDGPYRVFARKRSEEKAQWEQDVPIHVRAMVLSGDVLLVAGPTADPSEAQWAGDDQETRLLALSAADGEIVAQHPLDGPCVFDGLAVANGRLYISLENGSVVCLTAA